MRHPSLAIAVITTLLFSTFVVSVPLPAGPPKYNLDPYASRSHGLSHPSVKGQYDIVCQIFQFSIPVNLQSTDGEL